MEDKIVHIAERCRFEILVEGCLAYVEYCIAHGEFDIVHTVVPRVIGGRGIAARLVEAAYSYARAEGLQCVATCSYAEAWLAKCRK